MTHQTELSKTRRRNNRRNEDPKSLKAWGQGETTDNDYDEIVNLCS